ncbi:hypothetical protein SAMN04488005_1524 [Yoonia tamlensis]|uniref:Uncharacterized protein n=1 Tax=Yoonia tamlensis TaxID=390270 RepID=A0A1I6GEI0_9RHOB|nr:hypothetical protein [Yoonia tamlensis]SFR40589.1 hypothetical protein SAMN04488005_1524 [Yoonia tamlensis]
MTARRHTNLTIRGVTYRDADHAAAKLKVHPVNVRAHARAGTLHRCGAGKSGVEPMPVCVRGVDFESAEAAAAHFGLHISVVYRRLAAGRPNDIGRPNARGQHIAKPVVIGPVSFRSMRDADRALGFGKDYVQKAFKRNSQSMLERVFAAAMQYAATSKGARQ